MATNNSINDTATTLSPTNIHTSNVSFDSGTTNMSAYSVTTFTPNLSINGSTSGITYLSRSGTMIKIGKFGYIFMEMTLSSKGVSVGDVRISMGVTTNSMPIDFFLLLGKILLYQEDQML